MMNLEEALEPLKPVMGMSSVIAGLMSGDFDPLDDRPMTDLDPAAVEAKLKRTQQEQAECQSDWAYWGYEGQIAYLTALRDILEAFKLVSEVPYVEPPGGFVVMDVYSQQERYGREILRLAKEKVASLEKEHPLYE